MPNINLGLCCINTDLRQKGIFNSRTTIRKHFTVEKAQTLALQNVQDLVPMIEYNHQHGIHCFRWSSDIFPHFTDTETQSYNIDFAKADLARAGALANEYGQRIVMHPGQYNQVGAKTRDVFEKTIQDLAHHADILDAAGIDENGILTVHGGGTYGDKEATKRRWIEQFDDLPKNVKRRLCIENCEKSYSVRDVLDIAQECRIPVIFDCHHYDCYTLLHLADENERVEDMMPEIVSTWGNRKMLCHISSQGDGPIGHHADYIQSIPEYMLDIPVDYDLEVEAKMKEKAIFRLKKDYPNLF